MRCTAGTADAKNNRDDVHVRDNSPLIDPHCVDIYAGMTKLMTVQKISDEPPDIFRGY